MQTGGATKRIALAGRTGFRAAHLQLAPETRRLLPVLVPVILTGAVVVLAAAWAFVISGPSAGDLAGLAALVVAATLAEAFPVPVEGVQVGKTSLASVFVAASGVIYGWAAAALMAALAMVIVELAHREPRSRVAYNTALYALAGGAAGLAADALDGESLARLTLAALCGSMAFYVVDIGLLATVVARSRGERVIRLFPQFVRWTAVPFGIIASLTVILVVVWEQSPFVAVVLVAPLVAIALYQRRVHGALDRMRELDRLKNEFIAVVSHELRTPLASVYGAAMTLRREGLDQEGRDSLLSVIYSESERLAHLVDQVLWASRLEAGRLPPTIGECDPAGLAGEVVDAARAHLPAGLSLDLHLERPLPAVAADAERTKQVLVNLVENAVKYSPEGGHIEVSLERANGYVRFDVMDEGLGIPSAEQQRIFEKFHRLDPHLTRGVSGSGLGLYICRELVEAMNGRIWVVSREGRGSTFSFELPLADRGR